MMYTLKLIPLFCVVLEAYSGTIGSLRPDSVKLIEKRHHEVEVSNQGSVMKEILPADDENKQDDGTKYMFSNKRYFVDRYKGQLMNENVMSQNSVLWPKYKSDLDSLHFEHEDQRASYTNAIINDIAQIYYSLLKEEILKQQTESWSKLNDTEFHKKSESVNKENTMKQFVAAMFPEYEPFKSETTTSIWTKEKEFLESSFQYMIYKGLKTRGFEDDAGQFLNMLVSKLEKSGVIVVCY